ncbi:hypothetical protein GCM10010466_64760 [Planomonospora alba]|uniref:Uncharacterized protein n=1 Tax=Planomonospora alba TaxID=161354 RepID=A0ABP6P1N0_9ACTN
MSSVVLYLAIVVMWLCVLVPMWLRRDRTTTLVEAEADEGTGETGEFAVPYGETGGQGVGGEAEGPAEPVTGPIATAGSTPGSAAGPPGAASGPAAERLRRRRAAQRRRASLVAKRRRLLLWCVLLLTASAVTAAVRVIPWWGVAPSAGLLAGYLAVLRTSVRIDAERRRAAAQARAERARRARRKAAELAARRQAEAEVIELDAHRDELFDQYAEPDRRAVGD